MHSFLDAKIMAKALRTALAKRQIDITLSDSLELVARQFGLKDWNTLAAHIEAASTKLAPLPRGWYRTSTVDPALFMSGPDPAEAGAFYIESMTDADTIGGRAGALGQTILPDDFRGRMIRLTAELKGANCEDAATIWMRIDGPEPGKWLRFDNLIDRDGIGPLRGTFNWTRRDIVLDVPDEAQSIVFGILLQGTGRMWARGIDIGEAPPGSARTDYPRRPSGFEGGIAA
jgi:hypothetical protein